MAKSEITDRLKQSLKKPFKADLHVHTPASSDFNLRKPNDIEEEYLAILKMARREKVSILGITDHYSINGYIKLHEIKEKLDNKFRTTMSSKEEKLIEKKIKLFESLFIIPGVELKTRDGVEYIILFDPENPVKRIQSFLRSLDLDRSRDFLKIQSTDLTKRTKKFGCINIAAHADSNNGVYNVTENNPTLRILLFKDPNLDGMHFKSSVTRDKIKSLLKTPQYRRENLLTFIKCSDFHNRPGEKIGKEATYLKLNEPTFSELIEAFRNPVERISSPETFDTKKILNTLLLEENKLCIERLDNGTKAKFLQYVSAYSNSDGGYILIGVSEKRNIKGIDKSNVQSVVKYLVTILRDELDPRFPPPFSVIPYPYGEKLILSIFFPRYNDSIVMVKPENNAYELRENKPIVASSAAIMDIVMQKVKSECLTHLERYRILKNKIASDIKGIEDSLIVYPLLKKIARDGKPLRFLVDKLYGVPPSDLTVKLKKKILLYPNGNSTGTIVILGNVVPRYEYACLRYSTPTYRIKNISGADSEEETTKGCIVLCGGAVYILTHSVKKIILPSETGEFSIITEVASSLQKTWPVEYIVAFLKSSPFLWYIWEKYGEFNLVKKQTFLDLKIPSLDKEARFHIVTLVRELCKYEKSYLGVINKLEKERSKRVSENQEEELKKKINDLTNDCNSKIGKTSLEIDDVFYEKLYINEGEQEIIQDALKRLDLYVTGDSTEKTVGRNDTS